MTPKYPKSYALLIGPNMHACSYNKLPCLPEDIMLPRYQHWQTQFIKTSVLEKMLTFPDEYGSEV